MSRLNRITRFGPWGLVAALYGVSLLWLEMSFAAYMISVAVLTVAAFGLLVADFVLIVQKKRQFWSFLACLMLLIFFFIRPEWHADPAQRIYLRLHRSQMAELAGRVRAHPRAVKSGALPPELEQRLDRMGLKGAETIGDAVLITVGGAMNFSYGYIHLPTGELEPLIGADTAYGPILVIKPIEGPWHFYTTS